MRDQSGALGRAAAILAFMSVASCFPLNCDSWCNENPSRAMTARISLTLEYLPLSASA